MAERTPGFSHLQMHKIFPTNLGNCIIWVFFHIMAAVSDSDDEFSSSVGIHIIYTAEGYTDWKPWRNDHVVIVLFFNLKSLSMVVSLCKIMEQ